MKLAPRDAASYFARPDPAKPALLIYGEDAMRNALRRQEVIKAMLGPEGEAEMRLVALPAGELRRGAGPLLDEMRATGFFPGPRVVLIEDASDAVAPALEAALGEWREGDAHIVAVAGKLATTSKLRKLFEGSDIAYAAAIYDDPPSRAEIEAELRRAGLRDIDRDALGELETLAAAVGPGDFRQIVTKLSLYKTGDATAVTVADVAAVSPASTEADIDAVLDIVAEARTRDLGPILRRLEAQGTTPVSICIAATRHFRTLHAASADPAGPDRTISRQRPPVPYKRRDRLIRQARAWGQHKAARALNLLTDTDLLLRSSSEAPQMAVIERALIRLSMLGRS